MILTPLQGAVSGEGGAHHSKYGAPALRPKPKAWGVLGSWFSVLLQSTSAPACRPPFGPPIGLLIWGLLLLLQAGPKVNCYPCAIPLSAAYLICCIQLLRLQKAERAIHMCCA